jgi:hypothetical protein
MILPLAIKTTRMLKDIFFARDKILIIASEEVVRNILLYEKLYDEELEKANELHDGYLTKLIKSIRCDLNISYKNFPEINFKKA